MKKLSNFFNNSLLKIGVAFTLLFVALYPKLPSIYITHTWVYIRAEDFVITAVVFLWIIQLLRKKITLPFQIATPILIYWIVGLVSLLFSLLFIGPHLANFFPKIAALEYLRRIEYMILFFVAMSTIHSEKDIVMYLKIICATITGVIIYGFGQRWYLILWHQFPNFFEKYSFCFPSFQTGNEQFAKGLPLCLPIDARITSTFGGHYDLAAYLVIIIPILFASFFIFKHVFAKCFVLLLSVGSLMLLILTSSRTSFVAYLVGICCTLVFARKKEYIFPVLIFSIILLLSFSTSTAQRFLETIRFTSVVTNSQGQIVGVTAASLPADLQKKISKNPVVVEAPPPSQNLPAGSTFITLPQEKVQTTHVAVVQTSASQDKVRQLNYAYGGQEISTISGTFLVKKALVYDISITTRFQAEWPNAWNAFIRNPLLGSGYGSISLATDGDYFRMLGETGALGILSFALIFMFFGTLLSVVGPQSPSITRYFAYGVAGGVLGLFINATLIDVFESSKVAESLWILLGISVGGLVLYQKSKIDYTSYLFKIFTSNIFISIYLLIVTGVVFFQSVTNFFVADDFTWLRWAGESNIQQLKHYFTDASGFFYRPFDKFIIFALFSISAFQPVIYHVFILILHFLTAVGVYLLLNKIFCKKGWAFIGSLAFLLLPAHGENVYWLATISTTLSTLFIVYGILAWLHFRDKSIFAYIVTLLVSIFALLSYEMAVIIPGLLFISDILLIKQKKNIKFFIPYIPILCILGGYLIVRKAANAVSFGGDYSYNLLHFIPNFFGNLLGYLGLFVGGEYFFPTYTILRVNLKQYTIQLILISLIMVFICVIIGFWKRRTIALWFRNASAKIAAYGVAFTIIALLPFIGLGNITERYIYLSSVGFIIFFLSCIEIIFTASQKFGNNRKWLVVLVVVFILIWYGIDIKRESQQWQHAGDITQQTLSEVSTNFSNVSPNAHIYFVNVPIRYDNAWVFPVGLSDALWFIYRDSSPKTYQVKTVRTAIDLKNSNKNVKSYIFLFDKQGNLGEIE